MHGSGFQRSTVGREGGREGERKSAPFPAEPPSSPFNFSKIKAFPVENREIPLSFRAIMVFVSDPPYEITVFVENGTTYFSDGRNEVWMAGFSPLIRKRSKKITLKGSDGGVFEVDEAVALESEVIKHMIEGNCANDVIPLPIVSSYILSKVIEYCEKHVEMQKPGKDNNPLDEICLKCWDANFVKVDLPTLLGLQMAADYLNIRSLMELTYQTVLDMIKGMTFEELRKTFEIETDFSPQEEEEVTIKEKMGSKKVTLKSSDDQVFEVEAAVALESKTIKHMIENDCADGVIPLQNVTSEILSKVIEYCKKHVEMQKPGEDEDSDDSDWDDWIWEKRGDWVEWYLKCWDADFIKVNRTALRTLFWAARYLKIKSLLDLTLQGVADLLNMVEGEEEERRVLQVIFF